MFFSRLAAAVLYGDASQDTSTSLLINPARDQLLFSPAGTCLARRGCVAPGHPWYPRTTSGLDILVYYFVLEAKALLEDPPERLTPANPHFDFVVRAAACGQTEPPSSQPASPLLSPCHRTRPHPHFIRGPAPLTAAVRRLSSSLVVWSAVGGFAPRPGQRSRRLPSHVQRRLLQRPARGAHNAQHNAQQYTSELNTEHNTEHNTRRKTARNPSRPAPAHGLTERRLTMFFSHLRLRCLCVCLTRPQAQTILIVMFVASAVGNAAFLALRFAPWMRRVLGETARVAALLAEVRGWGKMGGLLACRSRGPRSLLCLVSVDRSLRLTYLRSSVSRRSIRRPRPRSSRRR